MGTPKGCSPRRLAEGLVSLAVLLVCVRAEDFISPAEGRVIGHPDVLENQA